ncbi:MAG: mechanosensitive ion channel [Candidatus Loosdrechtia sp.]|uniref:mechanosensitive ion channel n=1 Tax=Candidatus Loosdrechtia sp. TaxID=3101272 RepID=UPI003A748E9F|nr:MAG: mechanosensitive ion channel [Candidatus Jettenia sp. AMX2]
MKPVFLADFSAQFIQWLNKLGIDEKYTSWIGALSPAGKYIGALLIFFIGKFICKCIGKAVTKGMKRSGIEARLGQTAESTGATISALAGTLVYSILLLFVLIISLDFAGLSRITDPLTDLFGKFIGILPGLVSAGIIFFIGYFLAKVVRSILQNILSAAKVDERLGMVSGNAPIANGLSTAVFALIILWVIPTALEALGIKAIAEPIQGIVDSVVGSVEYIILAAAIAGVGIFVANLARRLVSNLLAGIGADSYPARIGLNMPAEGNRSVSSIAGLVTFVSILILAGTAALKELKIDILVHASENLFSGYFNILLALLIVGAGLIAARFAHKSLVEKQAVLAQVARVAIIVVSSVTALSRSGIAPDITSTPYLALIIATATALGIGGGIAIGLGSKDYVSRWLEKRG